jgi:hypothetical protein
MLANAAAAPSPSNMNTSIRASPSGNALLSLVDEERSLSQLSRLTQTPLNLLHHHIRKFMLLGLVRIARVQARAGAPIKYYRATARAFYVPAELMNADPGAALASQLRDLLARTLARAVQGVVYSHDGKGPRMRLVKDADPRTLAMELWLELHLSQADAAAMAGELRALLHRFEACSHKPNRRYLVHAALAATQATSSR